MWASISCFEEPQDRHHRAGRALAEAAKRGTHHLGGDVADGLEIFARALAFGDAGQYFQQALAADAAGNAFAARFGGGEREEVFRQFDHAGIVIHDDHAATAHHRAGFLE